MPIPPRIAVFPLLRGSQAKPTRGSKFLSVGLLKKGLPVCATGSDKFLRLASLPDVSVGTEDISYLNPKLRVRLDLKRQSSCK